jgi:hypothetical protein
MENKQIVFARVPLEPESPTPLTGGDEVFEGKYEVPYFEHHPSGDFGGTLYFANRNLTRMRRNPAPAFSAPVGLRELLRRLPSALRRSAQSRLRRVQAWIGRC